MVGMAIIGMSLILLWTGTAEAVLGFSFGASMLALLAKAGWHLVEFHPLRDATGRGERAGHAPELFRDGRLRELERSASPDRV